MWPFDQLRRLFGARPETINAEAANDRPHELSRTALQYRQAVRDNYDELLERALAGVSKRPIRDARGRFVKRRAF